MVGKQMDNLADDHYLRSFEHMKTNDKIEEFRGWCRTHQVKAVQGEYFPTL